MYSRLNPVKSGAFSSKDIKRLSLKLALENVIKTSL